MGANSSSFSELSTNEHLRKLSGADSISPNDPFWNQLLSFSFQAPRNRYAMMLILCLRYTFFINCLAIAMIHLSLTCRTVKGQTECCNDLNTDNLRDDIKSSGKFAIFSYLKIEGGEGVKGTIRKKCN